MANENRIGKRRRARYSEEYRQEAVALADKIGIAKVRTPTGY